MKRFHVNLSVKDLGRSVHFYSNLFGAPPTVEKPDYAKWMLEDPRINFSLSTHGAGGGIDHVGLQAQDEREFAELRTRLASADAPIFDQPDVTCCYAESTKAWVRDPDGVAWETFLTRADATVYGDGSRESAVRVVSEGEREAACCDRPQ